MDFCVRSINFAEIGGEYKEYEGKKISSFVFLSIRFQTLSRLKSLSDAENESSLLKEPSLRDASLALLLTYGKLITLVSDGEMKVNKWSNRQAN